ncbi:hypothetical protein ABG768_018564, partial [Culter alburnus]
ISSEKWSNPDRILIKNNLNRTVEKHVAKQTNSPGAKRQHSVLDPEVHLETK